MVPAGRRAASPTTGCCLLRLKTSALNANGNRRSAGAMPPPGTTQCRCGCTFYPQVCSTARKPMEAPSRRGSAAVSSNVAAAVRNRIFISYSHEDADSVRVIAEILEFLEGTSGRNSCCQSKIRTSGLAPMEEARKATGVGRQTGLSSGPPGRAPPRQPLAPPGELRRRLGPWRGFNQRATHRRSGAGPTTKQRPTRRGRSARAVFAVAA